MEYRKKIQARHTPYPIPHTPKGFTLIETLVAISLLTIAIVAPISLTVQSLRSAYYARDQVTAFYMAQEAVEAIRSVRDGQILQIAQSPNASSINIFGPIPLSDQSFRIDARQTDSSAAITKCSVDPGGVCIPLQTDGTLYGYESGWAATNFTRIVKAHFIGGGQDEIRVTVTVTWQTGAFQIRSFSISENMYRWVQDGSGTAS
jgi:prepilin-type N-terminal cleavage/methylation domain-containing protein